MKSSSVQLLLADEVAANPSWHMPPHRHSFHELIVVMDGAMRLETPEQSFVATAGDLLFYRAGCIHKETSDATTPVNTLYVAFRAVGGTVNDLPLRMTDSNGRVRQMLAWLVADYQAGGAPRFIASLLQAVLNELGRLQTSPVDPWLADLRRHMQKRMASALPLGDLARQAHMSKYGFIRKYKRLSGCTPMRDLRSMRLIHARSMILTSGLPMKAIAPAVGFSDAYRLSKLFRRHFRLSPSELRASLLS
jgi:AraC-like DNA-binding protein